MASEDEDGDLEALRSAVLASIKTKNSQNASPPLNSNASQRDSDLDSLRIAALHSSRPPDVSFQKYHPYPNRRGAFHREYGPPKSAFHMHQPFGHRHAPSNNLIVIQPVPIQSTNPALTVATGSQPPLTNAAFHARPPDRSTEDETSMSPSGQKTKRADKFSRFESDTESDSDDDYFLGKSDETNNDESSSSVGDDEQAANGEEDEGDEEEDEASLEPDLVDVLQLHTNEEIAEEEEQQAEQEELEEETETPQADRTLPVASSGSPAAETFYADEEQSLSEQPSSQDPLPPRDSRGSNSRRGDRREEDRRRAGGDRLPTRRERESCATASDREKDTIRRVTATDSEDRQRALRSERFGGGARPERRRENRIRDDNGARNGSRSRATGRTEPPPTKGAFGSDRKGGDSNQRRRAVSPPMLPLASSAARHNGERHEATNDSARNVSAEPTGEKKRVRLGRRSQKAKRVESDGSGQLNDLREKLKFRNREVVVDAPVVDRQRRRKEAHGGGEVPSPPRDLAARLERRDRSRSPFRRARGGPPPLQSIVKLQTSSGSRSLGDSPVRSPGHGSPRSEAAPSSGSKRRTHSPAFVESAESLNPRKVLIMKEKNYDDVISSRHRFSVMMTEAPDMPDSDSSSTNNRLPIHLRLGHFAKSSSATFDVSAPAESSRHSSRSSSERKTSSSRQQGKKKSRSSRSRGGAKDEGSPPRQVKLKRESFHPPPPSSSSVVSSSTSTRVASSSSANNNGLSSKRSQKQSGRTYESELDEKIRRIKEVNEAIMKRKSEIEKDQQANY